MRRGRYPDRVKRDRKPQRVQDSSRLGDERESEGAGIQASQISSEREAAQGPSGRRTALSSRRDTREIAAFRGG